MSEVPVGHHYLVRERHRLIGPLPVHRAGPMPGFMEEVIIVIHSFREQHGLRSEGEVVLFGYSDTLVVAMLILGMEVQLGYKADQSSRVIGQVRLPVAFVTELLVVDNRSIAGNLIFGRGALAVNQGSIMCFGFAHIV